MQIYVEIFLIGLFGSAHCIGMCGGFVAMYSLRKPVTRTALPYHLLYNLGRIITYSILGGIVGYLGSFFSYIGKLRGVPGAALLIAGTIMVLMGMNLAGMIGKRDLFEDTGITATSGFRRILHRLLVMENVWGAFLLGLLLGFLPCGLLYPVFISAAASGGFMNGMLELVFFGLGTVPAMLFFGALVTRLKPQIKQRFYRIAAFLIILLGMRAFLRGMSFNGWISPGPFW